MEKIKIKNYQRLEDIEIELDYGINLISGSSNNGKSSVIRAVRDLIFNKVSKDKIRHGQNSVMIEIDNAIVTRDKKGTIYTIDEEKLEKVGRNILPEIKDKFNIDEFEINGVTIKPNFWFQMDKPFLMDKSSSQKNDLLIGTKNDKYLKALKSINTEYMNLRRITKKSLEDVIDTLKKNNINKENKIKNYEGIEILIDKINSFEKKYEKYNKMVYLLNQLKTINEEKKLIKIKLEYLKNIDTEKIHIINDKYNTSLDNMNSIYSLYKEYKTSIDNIIEIGNKKYKIHELLINKDKIETLFKRHDVLSNDYMLLEKWMLEYNQSYEKANNILLISKTRAFDLDKLRKEFDEFKKKINVCPLCGNKLGGN